MEQRGQRDFLENIARTSLIVLGLALVMPNSATAQQSCQTVKECAQQMVELANELKKENEELLARMAALEKKHATDVAALNKNWAARITKLRTKGTDKAVHTGGNGQSQLCPNGSYMVGGRWTVTSGGSHGIMSWWAPICRTLP